MSNTTSSPTDINVTRVEIEIEIATSQQHVWDSYINDIEQWWPQDFLMATDPEKIILEPEAGGRLYELGKSGAGLLWATVIALDPPNSINFAGHLAPPWGGPALSYVWIRFESKTSETTVVKLTDTLLGHVDINTQRQMEEGWKLIYEGGLKAFVENMQG